MLLCLLDLFSVSIFFYFMRLCDGIEKHSCDWECRYINQQYWYTTILNGVDVTEGTPNEE